MSDLLPVADELYALPPGEFTSARNQRARQLRAEGDKELAVRVQQLRKPALAAWTVNMLVRREPKEVREVLELGVSLREAQANLDGDALRELTRQRRRLIAAMTTKARRLATELGERVSDTVARQVEDTLHAAMVDENAAAAVRSGLLTEPLASTGLGTLDISEAVADDGALARTAPPAAVPGPPEPARLQAVPTPEPTERDREEERRQAAAQARTALAQARATADEARRKLERRTERADRLSARRLQLAARMEELRRDLAEAEHRLESLDDEIEDAAAKRDRAEDRHRAAAAEAEQAEAALAELGDPEDRDGPGD